MYVKFSLRNLKPGFYPPHLTNTYTYEVTIILKVCGGNIYLFLIRV